MDERDSKDRSQEVASSEQSDAKPAAERRRDALFRMARLAAIPVAVAGLSQACGSSAPAYSRYSEYCDGACRNYTHYGDTYCNYSDYTDAACNYAEYCAGTCRNYSRYGTGTYCNYANYYDSVYC